MLISFSISTVERVFYNVHFPDSKIIIIRMHDFESQSTCDQAISSYFHDVCIVQSVQKRPEGEQRVSYKSWPSFCKLLTGSTVVQSMCES